MTVIAITEPVAGSELDVLVGVAPEAIALEERAVVLIDVPVVFCHVDNLVAEVTELALHQTERGADQYRRLAVDDVAERLEQPGEPVVAHTFLAGETLNSRQVVASLRAQVKPEVGHHFLVNGVTHGRFPQSVDASVCGCGPRLDSNGSTARSTRLGKPATNLHVQHERKSSAQLGLDALDKFVGDRLELVHRAFGLGLGDDLNKGAVDLEDRDQMVPAEADF